MLYTGDTGELQQRMYQHREKPLPGFTSHYNASKRVYYALKIRRQPSPAKSRLKAGSRRKKIDLVTGFNPQWGDLFDDLR